MRNFETMPTNVFLIREEAPATVEASPGPPGYRPSFLSSRPSDGGNYIVRLSNKKKTSVQIDDIIFLFKEGGFVIHEEFGIGRVVVPPGEKIHEVLSKAKKIKKMQEASRKSMREQIMVCGPTGVEFIKPIHGGHSCNNRGVNPHCLWLDSRELSYISFSNLRGKVCVGKSGAMIGGKVTVNKVIIKSTDLNGKGGVFREYIEGIREAIIELDDPVAIGHSVDGKYKSGSCVSVPVDSLVPVNPVTNIRPEDGETISPKVLQVLSVSGLDISEYIEKAEVNWERGAEKW